MRIQTLAKVVLLPGLLYPVLSNRNEAGAEPPALVKTLTSHNVTTLPISKDIPFLELVRTPESILKGYVSHNEGLKQSYKITETITDQKRIEAKYAAYYKVNTEGWFYIVQRRDCKKDNVFALAFDGKEKAKGLLFPEPKDSSKPVAVIDGSAINLSGVFEIYDTGDSYSINYQISPLISLPKHTDVDSDFLLNVDETIKKMPKSLVDSLASRGVEVMLARNVEDSYYYLYPSWKEYDRKNPNDPSKPWLEVREDGCKDNRNYSNTGALYYQKKVIIPQQHYEYGTRKIIDRITQKEWTKFTTGHEVGHSLDFFNMDDYYFGNQSPAYASKKKSNIDRYSGTSDYLTLFEVDKKRMDPAIKKKLAYSWCKSDGGEAEGFANQFAALMGTMSKDETALLLSAFPNSTEHLRKNVLPVFGVTMSVEDVRKNVYPDYLKDAKGLTKAEKEQASLRLFEMFSGSRISDSDLTRIFAAPPPCCGNK